MQHKRLVIDANILIRAVFGQRVRELIASASEHVAFYVAEANLEEARHYLAQLAPRRGIPEEVWRASLDTLMCAVQLVGEEELALVEADARARIGRRDEHDWPGLAAALLMNCPIWTEDKDFFGTGVPTWTTATVQIYLTAQ
jgi:predicted nucleic acid-binding protein